MRLAVLACGTAAIGLTLLALAGPSYRVGVLSLANAFTLFGWGAYPGAVGALLGAAAALFAYKQRDTRRLLVAVLALLMGLVALAVPLEFQRRAQNAPPIHDITTDLENPPQFEAVVPLRADAPNSLERPSDLADLQRAGYPDIAPITLPLPREQVFDRALTEAQQQGWEIVTADKSTGRIEATDTTPWFGFKDDIAIRVIAWGTGTRVDVRSVSRVGRSDMGANARRIRDYLAQLPTN